MLPSAGGKGPCFLEAEGQDRVYELAVESSGAGEGTRTLDPLLGKNLLGRASEQVPSSDSNLGYFVARWAICACFGFLLMALPNIC